MKKISTDHSVRLDIYSREGDTFERSFTFLNSDGTPFDFTGYTQVVEIKRHGGTSLVTFAEGSGLTESGGVVTLKKDSLELTKDNYIYAWKITYPDGDQRTWLNGNHIVHNGVFDNFNSTSETITISLSGEEVTVTVEAGGSSVASASQQEVNTGSDVAKYISPSLLKNREIQTFTLANELTFDDARGKKSMITNGGSFNFTLASAGNKDGAVIIARMNKPALVDFSLDFEAYGGSESIDLTKLVEVWMMYDAELSKVYYSAKNVSALDLTSPTVTSAEVSADTSLVVTFNEAVTITDLTGLSLNFTTGTAKTLLSVSGSGTNTLTFTLSGSVLETDVFDFVYGASNNISDASENILQAGSTAVVFEGYDAAAEALFTRMATAGTEPDATRKGHINTLIKGLKTDGIWSKLGLLQIYAAHDSPGSLLNWLADASNGTNNAATFTIDQGYTGNGTSASVASNYLFSSNANTSNQDNISVFAWELSNLAENTPLFAAYAVVQTLIYPRRIDDKLRVSVNDGTSSEVTASNLSSNGLYVAQRSAAGSLKIYKDTTLLQTFSIATSALQPNDVDMLLQSNGPVYSNRQIAVFGAGAGDIDAAQLHSRLNTFLTAIGAI